MEGCQNGDHKDIYIDKSKEKNQGEDCFRNEIIKTFSEWLREPSPFEIIDVSTRKF